MEIKQRPMQYTSMLYKSFLGRANSGRGGEPLTPEDIAEVIVFAVGRRENVIIADTLIFPGHQVCPFLQWFGSIH
jgi:hypothetical protein